LRYHERKEHHSNYLHQPPDDTVLLKVNQEYQGYQADSVVYDQGMAKSFAKLRNLEGEENKTKSMNILHNLYNLKVGNDIYNEPNPFHSN